MWHQSQNITLTHFQNKPKPLIINIVEQTERVSDVQRLVDSLGQLPEPVVKPTFVVVSGLPGTGKSYFSRKLAEILPFAVLESDALRKTLCPLPTYSAEESARLFQVIHTLIEKLLKKGIPVIPDATNLSERFRERLYNIADRLNVKLILVSTEATPEIVHERLTRHEGTGDDRGKSDAGWEVYEKLKPTVEKISRRHYVVDTSKDITQVLKKIAREVKHS